MSPAYDELVSVYIDACSRFSKRELFGTKRADRWTWTTYEQFGKLVDRLRGGLTWLGVAPGDRVAIVSRNRVEWAVACYATYGLGAAFVPMYEAQREEEVRFILGDSGAKVVFASTQPIYDSLRRTQRELSGLAHVVGLDLPETDPASFAQLLDRKEAPPPLRPSPSSIAGLVYTSGTTGQPKGVLLTHRNIASNLNAIREAFPIGPEERSLSFLPWAHSYGQTCELHYLLSSGASTAINGELKDLLPNLASVAPTVLVAVPRIFNALYESVYERVEERSKLVQMLFSDGVQATVRRHRGEHVGALERLEMAIDDKLIFAKVRERLGGRLKFVISASASLSKDVAEFIDALGIPIYEGYGLSETSPAVSMNRPGHCKLGTVGQPIPGVRIEIDHGTTGDDLVGEILVYGPNVMQGYHNRPEETARALTPDGGLRTGDLGYLDEDGFLHVVGRIKDQYKLDSGKYVMPGPIEEQLSLSPFIANVMLYGDNRPYNVAVVVPERGALEKWAAEQAVDLRKGDATQVRALLKSEILVQSHGLRPYEVPKRFVIASEDFTTSNGLLTPTLKVRRQKVLERYSSQIEALYEELPGLGHEPKASLSH